MRRAVIMAEVAMVVLLSLTSFIANLLIDTRFPEYSGAKPAIALSSAFFCLSACWTGCPGSSRAAAAFSPVLSASMRTCAANAG